MVSRKARPCVMTKVGQHGAGDEQYDAAETKLSA
jgi:hypothetical protein